MVAFSLNGQFWSVHHVAFSMTIRTDSCLLYNKNQLCDNKGPIFDQEVTNYEVNYLCILMAGWLVKVSLLSLLSPYLQIRLT